MHIREPCPSLENTSPFRNLQLKALRCLRLLDVSGCSVKGDALGMLPPCLTGLHLRGCAEVDDARLGLLGSAPRLETLEIAGCAVTDRGLEHLGKSFTSLVSLSLAHCRGITDNGLRLLRPIRVWPQVHPRSPCSPPARK